MRTNWRLISAAALIAGLLLLDCGRSSVKRLVALAPRSDRFAEARLTGGFAWAPYRGVARSAGQRSDSETLKLAGAAGDLVERANRDGNAEAQHDAGVAMVLVQSPADGIPRLEAAAAETKDAKVLSDLAAARYTTATQLGRASLYPTALAAADEALRIEPRLPEALFNRALILDRIGLSADARHAWQRYLEEDSSSEWATEARSRMARLPVSTAASQFDRDRSLFELAAQHGDGAAVRRYVDANRERARVYAEREYLGDWGEALQRGDAVQAARSLSVARAVGDALVQLSGEAMLHDEVQAIDSASPETQRVIAAGHAAFRGGRHAQMHGEFEAAERDLLRSAEVFDSAHAPMALEARHYAASVRLARNDATGARADLTRLLDALEAHPHYISLGGRVRWELGRTFSYEDDWSRAAALFADGAAMFRRTGETASEGMMQNNLAFALTALGRNDDAWLARMRAFSVFSMDGDERISVAVSTTAAAELTAGHRDAALALSDTEAAVTHSALRPDIAIIGLVNRALLQSMSGDAGGAMQSVQRAQALAQAVADPRMRANWNANIAIAEGAVLTERSPRAATAVLTRSIDFYAAHAMDGALLDPLILRSRCAVRNGDAAAAMRDLERGMSIVEGHPSGTPGSPSGWSTLDAEHAVFTDAIRLSLDRGDKAGAFAFAERSHGSTATVATLQQHLAGSGTTVLEIVALPDELVTFAVSESDMIVTRHAAAVDALAPLADEMLSETGTVAATKLYDELIRPAGALLDRAAALVVVADRKLTTVPFAALYDSQNRRFLVERFPLSVATSAGLLQRDEPRTARPSLAAIVLPSGGAESNRLPESELETRDVAGLYAQATSAGAADATFAKFRTESSGADVIHLAGHTERQPGGGEQALLFADGRVSWKTIVASPPPLHGVVILAACETLRPPPSASTRAVSLGAAFSAAGASDVIGTLIPIGDREARTLFVALHRRLATGENAAESLRAVQQEAISAEKSDPSRRTWRAIALLTRRIPAPSHGKELSSWAK